MEVLDLFLYPFQMECLVYMMYVLFFDVLLYLNKILFTLMS